MKFTVLTDTIPNSCTECPFYMKNVIENETDKNIINVISKCLFDGEGNEKCPLTEVKTIWEI